MQARSQRGKEDDRFGERTEDIKDVHIQKKKNKGDRDPK